MITLLWALWRLGAVAVPLSTRLPAAEVERHARRVGCERLVEPAGSDGDAPQSESLARRSPEEWVEEDGEDNAGGPGRGADDRPATIVFTSGSTGTPKAALHTWRNHRYSAKGSNANLPLREGDRWLLSLPLYHVGGLAILFRCALAGATVALPPPDAPLADGVSGAGATHLSLVATQLRRLLEATAGAPPPSLRAVLLGGGPLPEALLRRGHERGWPLLTSYGCTEMASQVATTAPGAPLDALRTAGRRLPHRRLRIEDGQIMVAGAPLFAGYVTAEGLDDPRTDDGWYPTGDRGRIDASGRLHVLGRMDRMFVSGGENVQPEEIEAALEQIDGVDRAVVVPVPDAEYGRRPVAFVRTTATLAPSRFRAALADTLPAFKIPDAFHPLPRAATRQGLKIDREQLRNRARKLREMNATDGNTP
jgi:O-succinylbenzoic acid--CoA ligase